MKKNILYVIATIAMVAAILLTVLTQDELELQQNVTLVERLVMKENISQAGVRENTKNLTNGEVDGQEFKRCESLVRTLTNRVRAWQNQEFILPSQLDNKYSSDDILVALEVFGLSQTHYIQNLDEKRETKSTGWKRLANNDGRQPEEFVITSDKGLKFIHMRRFFKKFLQLSASEQQNLVQNIPIIADDIATMFSDGFNEKEIIDVLRHFQDVNARIGISYEHVREFGLIDKAAASGFLKVFDYLIERGAAIENRRASLNTLEYAIFHSRKSFGEHPMNNNREAFEKIIRTLRNYNLPLRIREDRFSSKYYYVGGAGSRKSYNMPNKEAVKFYSELGLNFENRIDVNHFKESANQELVMDLENLLKKDLYDKEGTTESDVENCTKHVSTVKHTLTRHSVAQIIKSTIEKYSGHSDKVIEALQSIEPGLVEMYKSMETQKREPLNIAINLGSPDAEIHRLVMTGKYDKAVEYLARNSLTDKDKHAVFWKVYRSDAKEIDFLIDNGLAPQYEDYREAARLTPTQLGTLELKGYQFRKFDERGKNLVFYAVFTCNADLIIHLLKEGYPYSFDGAGEDPLSAAIRYSNCTRWASKKYERNYNPESVIESILQFEPEIQTHHLKRMAEMKLLRLDDYKKVIEKSPQLMVDNGVLPSGYYVEYQEMWSGIKYQQ